MRAAVVREFNQDLSLETVDDPACPDTGVVLAIASCGVCRSDYHGWTGGHPKVSNGSILGHEYCGTVVEAGPRAQYKVGDKLIAHYPAWRTAGGFYDRGSGQSRDAGIGAVVRD